MCAASVTRERWFRTPRFLAGRTPGRPADLAQPRNSSAASPLLRAPRATTGGHPGWRARAWPPRDRGEEVRRGRLNAVGGVGHHGPPSGSPSLSHHGVPATGPGHLEFLGHRPSRTRSSRAFDALRLGFSPADRWPSRGTGSVAASHLHYVGSVHLIYEAPMNGTRERQVTAGHGGIMVRRRRTDSYNRSPRTCDRIGLREPVSLRVFTGPGREAGRRG